MSIKRTSAKTRKLKCVKCTRMFSVTAFIFHTLDASLFWKERAKEHDCAAHEKRIQDLRNAKVNPLKAAKQAMKNKSKGGK